MIETFVLIIMLKAYAITTVPGYPTRAACEQSQKEVEAAPSRPTFSFCIRGPNTTR